jgi:predicted DNA-binding transcriptional regulator YafY
MTTMNDTLLRWLLMLNYIPRQPRKVDTERIKQFLEERQYKITLRSIQRDLNKLSLVFPLIGDNARPQGWCWQADATQFTLPGLDPQAALTLHMVEQHIKPLLPATTLTYLQPWFKAAEGVLAGHGNGLSKWPDKVRVLPKGFPRIAPTIIESVQIAVTDAVLSERQLEITYLANGSVEPWTRTVHPMALVVRDQLTYLLCVFADHTDVRQLVLHRAQEARVLDAAAIRPPDFDLDAIIVKGEFGMPQTTGKLKLEAHFAPHIAIHLEEAPVSSDQQLDELDGKVRLRATVADTLEMRLWLRSYGNEVVIVKPVRLRREFREIAEDLARQYADDGER